MARKKKTSTETIFDLPESVSPLLTKQATRLKALYALPDDHPGVLQRREDYVEAMKRQGLKNPPTDKESAFALSKLLDGYSGNN